MRCGRVLCRAIRYLHWRSHDMAFVGTYHTLHKYCTPSTSHYFGIIHILLVRPPHTLPSPPSVCREERIRAGSPSAQPLCVMHSHIYTTARAESLLLQPQEEEEEEAKHAQICVIRQVATAMPPTDECTANPNMPSQPTNQWHIRNSDDTSSAASQALTAYSISNSSTKGMSCPRAGFMVL